MTLESRDRWETPAPRIRDVTHVHPEHDPRAWHWFARGPLIAADGGERVDDEDDQKRNIEDEQLRDVSHEAKHDQGANQVWERGEDDEDEA